MYYRVNDMQIYINMDIKNEIIYEENLVVGSVLSIFLKRSYPTLLINGGIVNSPFIIFLYNLEVSGSSNGRYLL